MLALNYVKKNLRAGGFAQAVLAYLADCMNEADGKCFPSRETIAEYFSSEDDPCTVKRVDRALARLRELGFIKSECVPHRKQPAKGIEGGWHNEYSFPGLSGGAPKTDATHRNGVDPIAGVSPTVGRGSPQIGQGVAPTVERGSPHRGVEKQKETEVKQKRNSSSTHTCEEPPFDDELFNEARQVASENLESFENEVCAEAACSGIDQTPAESIEILHATRSKSFFGANTSTGGRNAAERKSEAISKPRRRAAAPVERPADVSAQAWDDWMTIRKAKRLPVTPTALAGIRREAERAGVSLTDAITFSVEQGWAGFRADWYSRATAKSSPAPSSGGRYLTAQERYEERLRKAGEMTDAEYMAQFLRPTPLEIEARQRKNHESA